MNNQATATRYIDAVGFEYIFDDKPFFTHPGGHRLWLMRRARRGTQLVALVDQSSENPCTVDDARGGAAGPLLVDADKPMRVVFRKPGLSMVIGDQARDTRQYTLNPPVPEASVPMVSDVTGETSHAVVSLATGVEISRATGARLVLSDGAEATVEMHAPVYEPEDDWSLKEMADAVLHAQSAVNPVAVLMTASRLARALRRRDKGTDAIRGHVLMRCMGSKISSLLLAAEGHDWRQLERWAKGDINGLEMLEDAIVGD